MTALHADALAVLRGWRAPDPAQEALRRRFVIHLEEHADGTLRDCFPAHLTASTLVLSGDGRRVLLTLHRKARRWFQMGGHCEPGDTTLAAAAAREAAEESGITTLRLEPQPVHLDAHRVDFCHRWGPVHHLDVRFAALAPDDARHRVSGESEDVAWFALDALPVASEELIPLVDHARERLQRSPAGPPSSAVMLSSGPAGALRPAENPSR